MEIQLIKEELVQYKSYLEKIKLENCIPYAQKRILGGLITDDPITEWKATIHELVIKEQDLNDIIELALVFSDRLENLIQNLQSENKQLSDNIQQCQINMRSQQLEFEKQLGTQTNNTSLQEDDHQSHRHDKSKSNISNIEIENQTIILLKVQEEMRIQYNNLLNQHKNLKQEIQEEKNLNNILQEKIDQMEKYQIQIDHANKETQKKKDQLQQYVYQLEVQLQYFQNSLDEFNRTCKCKLPLFEQQDYGKTDNYLNLSFKSNESYASDRLSVDLMQSNLMEDMKITLSHNKEKRKNKSDNLIIQTLNSPNVQSNKKDQFSPNSNNRTLSLVNPKCIQLFKCKQTNQNSVNLIEQDKQLEQIIQSPQSLNSLDFNQFNNFNKQNSHQEQQIPQKIMLFDQLNNSIDLQRETNMMSPSIVLQKIQDIQQKKQSMLQNVQNDDRKCEIIISQLNSFQSNDIQTNYQQSIGQEDQKLLYNQQSSHEQFAKKKFIFPEIQIKSEIKCEQTLQDEIQLYASGKHQFKVNNSKAQTCRHIDEKNSYQKSFSMQRTSTIIQPLENTNPYESFMILLGQCVKLNSQYFEIIYDLDISHLFELIKTKDLPIQKWQKFLEEEIEKEGKQRKDQKAKNLRVIKFN